MKRYYFLIVMLMSMVTACSDWIEENDFTYAIATSTFYNTPDEANAAVMAPLNTMRSIFNSNYFTTLEGCTEYCYTKGVYQAYGRNYVGVTDNTHFTRCDANWQNFYVAILQCNLAIQKIPDANAMTDNEKAAYVGELRFLRALCYFHIVRRWASVPLRTEENMEEIDLAKTPVNEIYNFIVNDLKYAVDNCPNTPRLIGTPAKNAAKALLAEVYMYTQDYASARNLAAEVIDSKAHSLVQVSVTRDFDKLFGYDLATSTEEMFYIKTSRTDERTWSYISFTAHPQYEIEPGQRMLNGFGYFTHYSNLGNELIANWDQNDLRYDLNVGFYEFGVDAYGPNTTLFIKFWDPLVSGDGANVSIPLIRYADVLITYYEATARVAGAPTEESIEMLNRLRRRGYGFNSDVANPAIDYKLSDYNTMDSFIDLLIQEERYERMNEAKHWDLIVRLGKANELVGKYFRYDGITYNVANTINDKHYLWKIPDSEFNYNKALDPRVDQNPGYAQQ